MYFSEKRMRSDRRDPGAPFYVYDEPACSIRILQKYEMNRMENIDAFIEFSV